MKNIKSDLSPDTYFWHVSRIACFVLAAFSIYVLRLTIEMTRDPALAVSLDSAIPEMIKNILAGCAAVFFFGFIFELEARAHR